MEWNAEECSGKITSTLAYLQQEVLLLHLKHIAIEWTVIKLRWYAFHLTELHSKVKMAGAVEALLNEYFCVETLHVCPLATLDTL